MLAARSSRFGFGWFHAPLALLATSTGGIRMKPDDKNGKLPTSQRPFRVLILAGANRRQCNCPGVDSKSRSLHCGNTQRSAREKMYSDNQAEDMIREVDFRAKFDAWAARFASHVEAKGKIEPGRFRAFGYEPPSHRWAHAKLKRRELRMNFGNSPGGSPPAEQEQLGLNDDATLHPKRSERDQRHDWFSASSPTRRPVSARACGRRSGQHQLPSAMVVPG